MLESEMLRRELESDSSNTLQLLGESRRLQNSSQLTDKRRSLRGSDFFAIQSNQSEPQSSRQKVE
jgi:hypothetical protein